MADKKDLHRYIDNCFINERICPLPTKWNDLFNLLKRNINSNELSPPLILGGWWESTDHEKKIRFISHIEFAFDNGIFENIKTFIGNLTEEQWHHSTD